MTSAAGRVLGDRTCVCQRQDTRTFSSLAGVKPFFCAAVTFLVCRLLSSVPCFARALYSTSPARREKGGSWRVPQWAAGQMCGSANALGVMLPAVSALAVPGALAASGSGVPLGLPCPVPALRALFSLFFPGSERTSTSFFLTE